MSDYEVNLHSATSANLVDYNNTIMAHNQQYIHDKDTILYILRNPVAVQMVNLMAIQQNQQALNHNMANNNNNSAMPTA